MPRNTNKAQYGWVPLQSTGATDATGGEAGVKYVFACRALVEYMEILGITLLESMPASLSGYIVGANSPKPGRARKKLAATGGSVSSFFNPNQASALRTEGWKLSRGVPHGVGGKTSLSVAVYVPINGINYAWHLTNATTAEAITEETLAVLEVLPVEPSTADLVWGAKFPKPPKAKTVTKEGSLYSTFCSPTLAAIPEGWTISTRKAAYSTADFENYIGATAGTGGGTGG